MTYAPAVEPGEHARKKGALLGTREFRCLPHHAQYRQALHALGQVKVDQAVGAFKVERSVIGEALGSRTSALEAQNVQSAATRPHDVLIRYHFEQFFKFYGKNFCMGL